ncbi:AAA family ATPase [Paracoccus sp. MKU1]|uniref:AAA family ATPase n=1 Tax=Paracoccus sp. MKU1 TaxID=1745182 RepID=UPI00137A29B1|nr:AAA family ATPase [Paracoccus sp. MKU1]
MVEAVKAYAFSRQRDFFNWSLLYGWETYSRTSPTDPPKTDGNQNPVDALNKIGAVGPNPGEAMPNGFYTFMFPHFWLKDGVGQRVPMIFALKEYTRMFAVNKQRLIMVAPLGFTLPPEVSEDVVVLDFDAPSYAELMSELDGLMSSLPKQPRLTKEDRDRIVAAGMGMSQQEFVTAVSRAVVTHRHLLPAVPVDDLVDEVMKVKTEVVKRSEVLEVMPTTNMSQVGGLDQLKEWVRKRSRCFSQDARDYGIEAPKGCGLFGPPGTGKSLSAKAIGHALGLPLIKFDVSRVFQSLVGQSEERVRAALKMLDAMAPCVVLLDEIDKAFQRSSGGDSGVSQRVLGAILTHMQETEAPIFWVFSANRVDNLPPELLRKGRLDEIFAVTVPDEGERLEILKIHLRKRGHNPDTVANLQIAAQKSDGYVPAEIEQAVKDALIDAFTDKVPVTGDLIAHQLDNIKPLSEAFAEDFNRMQSWAENNARPASKSIIQRKAEKAIIPVRTRPGMGRSLEMGG